MIFLRINFTLVTNVQTSKQRVKNWQLIGGPCRRGPPSMVQPAQWIIRPWSAITKNPMVNANLMPLCFIESELCIARICIFEFFLLLWPKAWPSPDDLHIRTFWLPVSWDVQIWTFYIKAFESYHLTDRQKTDTTEIIYHAASWMANNIYINRLKHSATIRLNYYVHIVSL